MASPELTMVFVVNPCAGQIDSAEGIQKTLQSLLSTCECAQPCEFLLSESSEALVRDLKARLQDTEHPVDTVVAVGGDGTVMTVQSVLIAHRKLSENTPDIRFGIIPMGTGNLLAVNLGIPMDFCQSVYTLVNGQTRRIDAVRVNGSYFTLLAGIGIPADIMQNTGATKKRILGIWAYFMEGICRLLHPQHAIFTINLDGRIIRKRGIGVIVSNAGSNLTGMVPFTLDSQADDGVVEVLVIRSSGLWDYLLEFFGRLSSSDLKRETVLESFRGRRIAIHCWPRMNVQADGNVIGKTPVFMEVLPAALAVLVPAASPEASGSVASSHHSIRPTSTSSNKKLSI